MRFCGHCGHPLPVKCPRCGAANPAGNKVCRNCSQLLQKISLPAFARRSPLDYTPPFLVEKVLRLRNSIQGERKEASVLFLDVVGFTKIAERFDAEDVHEMINGCFEILGQEIHGVGGTINQYTGDGVMALFGAPIAYEDHYHRACYAALRIKERLKIYGSELHRKFGIRFEARMGLHMGPVVVGAIGDNLRLDYTAVGDTTNLAARLESMVPPGGIWVSKRMRDAAHTHFRFRKAGIFDVKGIERPVTVFSLLGVREGGWNRSRRRLKSVPFIGRQDELVTLDRAYQIATRRTPFLMALEGEPGIGKTRLLEHFRDLLDPARVLYLEGRCYPYGEAMAFHPLTRIFQRYFHISDRESFDTVRKKVVRRLDNKNLLPLFENIFSYFERIRDKGDSNDYESRGCKRELFVTIRSLFQEIMNLLPVVLVLDDMQWVDPTTRDFLKFFIESNPEGPLLVICSGRIPHSEWCPTRPHGTIRLGPLQDEEALKIFNAALGTDRLEPKVLGKALSTTGGNPLFLIELGENLNRQKMVVCDERKCTLRFEIRDMRMPKSLRDILAARLDALPEVGKRICQLASIVGTVFSYDMLEKLVGDKEGLNEGLAILEDGGIVDSLSGEKRGRYIFRHQMMQNIAYSSLLRKVRRAYHRKAAENLEKLYRDNLHAQAGSLSFHFYQAREWAKAFAYTLEAGQQARKTFACEEALKCYDRAIDIINKAHIQHDKDIYLQLLKWKGGMHFCLGDLEESRAAFRKMLSKSRRQADIEAEMDALFRLGWIAFYSHRPRSAEHFLSHAMDRSEALGVTEVHLKASSFLGQLYAVLGRMKKAKPLLVRALDLSQEVSDPEGTAWILAFLAQYYNWTGDFAEALAVSDELKTLNTKMRSPYFNILLHFRQSLIYGALGELDRAEKSIGEGLKGLEAGDDPFWRPRLLNTLGWIKAEGGDFEKALALNKQSLDEALPTGDPETVNNALINMGENLTELNKLSKAQELLEVPMREVGRREIIYTRWRYKNRLFLAAAELHRKKGEDRLALELANRALQGARKMGAKKHEALALHLKARLMAQRRPQCALKSLEQAGALARKMGTRLLEERIESDRKRLIISRAPGNSLRGAGPDIHDSMRS